MATHRVYGTVRVAGAAAARSIDIISASDWNSGGLAAGIVSSVTSDADTGEWSADLDGDGLVYAIARPVPPYPPMMLGPFKPVPL